MADINIPPDLRDKLKKTGLKIDEGGSAKKITVMFADMRGFTYLLEKRNVKRVLKILDIYFHMLVSIVRKYDGVVDKFLGDGLMAVWGLPEGNKYDTYNAVRAALEMRIGMFRLIPELVKIGEVPLEIGIGIGTGKAVTGFVGPASRRDFTLVGNCINRAARLQSIASDNRIFIDSETEAAVKPYTYSLAIPAKSHTHVLQNEDIFELEGIYDFSEEFESVRKHPRVIVAKVVGITKARSKERKVGLIRSIGEGGFGVEMHDDDNFKLNVGDEARFDSSRLSMFENMNLEGIVVRKNEIKGGGIFRIKTWDIGVQLVNLPMEIKRKLMKILVGSKVVRGFSGDVKMD
jgi:class 3 adenylate cyclase